MRQSFAAPVARPLLVDRALVKVVLHGEILAPHSGIFDAVVQLHHPIKRIPGFLLMLEDIDQQSRQRDCRQRGKGYGCIEKTPVARAPRISGRHESLPPKNCFPW